MFLDCFGKKLKSGDDVVITIDDILYDGIIINIYNDMLIITYHYWKDNDEIEKDIKFYDYDTNMNKLLNVYRI